MAPRRTVGVDRPLFGRSRQSKEAQNLFCSERVVEDSELVQATVPHVEIAFFRRVAGEIQLGANGEALILGSR
jgi:hypothetical protein